MQFAGTLNGESFSNDRVEQIEASNYLEKIFQIPFHLKEAESQSIKEMIRQLATTKLKNSEINSKQHSSNKEDNSLLESNEPMITESGEYMLTESEEKIEMEDKLEITISEEIKFIELTELEVELLQDMAEVIGSNPRAIKRFVNIFKIIKAHEDFTIQEENNREELIAILLLLALSIGRFRCLASSFEDYIENPSNENRKITFYLQDNHMIAGSSEEKQRLYYQEEKRKLDIILSENRNFHILQNLEARAFNNHNAFIKRFTFQSI